MAKLTKKQTRAALDAVLEAAIASGVSVSDCASWLVYATARDDARLMAKDLCESKDPDDRADGEALTVKDDIWAQIEDREGGAALQDAYALGSQLDPGFNKPILGQIDWLDRPKV